MNCKEMPLRNVSKGRGGEWAKWMKGRRRHRLLVMASISHRNKRHSIRNTVNDTIIALYGTYGSCTCGEQSPMCKLAKSLSCIPESNVILCVNYTQQQQKECGVPGWLSR